MWRVGSCLIRSQQRRVPGRLLASRCWGGDGNAGSQSSSVLDSSTRFFSRRLGGSLGDADEELREMQEVDAGKKRAKTISAADMEFYNQIVEEDSDDEDNDENAIADEEYRRKQEEIQRELDTRTGRPWKDPWEISEEQWMSTASLDDLPSWSPEFVSRISQERVKVHPDGIPTLSTLASLPLPAPASPHPGLGQAKAYASFRKEYHYRYLSDKVKSMAEPKVAEIVAIPDWDDKQDAVDELFESIEEEISKKEEILGKHPLFGKWVERALEEYLQSVRKGTSGGALDETPKDANNDVDSVPFFMDCYNTKDGEKQMVPTILSPLKPHKKDGPGRMVEEWELSAHKKTKRILLRQCTRSIAQTLEENESSRIFVHGRKGVGKSAVLASIVASARKSGNIVLYLPDGDRLRKNGFFVTPNALRDGMFDLQNLSQEACEQLLSSHESDLAGFVADKGTMELYFKESQLKKITNYSVEGEGEMSLIDLLKYAQEKKAHAPMCYSVVVDCLMDQNEKPFLMVMDEFNCYYDHGHYFHMAYDEEVREAIPYEKINLFEHALSAMALSTNDNVADTKPKMIKRGAIIVAVTESHAIRRKVTDELVSSAESQSLAASNGSNSAMHVIEVPRFSDIEADHILANFEATGIGQLRLDRGDTVMDEQEVAYLKMISGCVGQQLLDASVA